MENGNNERIVIENATPCAVLTTFDAAYSIKLFIEEYYSGCIEFEADKLKNNVILYNKNSLAFALKAIIKELTLKRVCKISFESDWDCFLIVFKTHEQLPDKVYNQLSLISKECGFILELDQTALRLGIPVKRKIVFSLYERMQKTFFFALVEAFSKDT